METKLTKEQEYDIQQFESFRNQLNMLMAQRQQVTMQVESIKVSLKELEKTSEKTAFRIVGSVIVNVPIEQLKKDLAKEQEELDLQLKTVETQEKRVTERLNKLKAKIEESLSGKSEEAAE